MKYEPIEEPHDKITDELNDEFDDDPTDILTQEDLPVNLSKKERFGRLLVGELPRCPECLKLLRKRALERCDYCGFSFSYLEKLLPVKQLPPLETLLDFSKKLEDNEKERILEAISFIHKRYPQFIPKVCLLPLQSDAEVQQMALWMINKCPVIEGETEADKEWYVLLLIDTSAAKCALTYGYQAEIFIPDGSSSRLVSTLNRTLKKDRIGKDIEELLNGIVPILNSTKKTLKRKFKRFKRKN